MFTLSYYPYDLQFKRPAGTSRGFLRTKTNYFLRLSSDIQPDIVGWGECGPIRGLSVDDCDHLEDKLDQVCRQINAGALFEDLELEKWPSIAFGLEMARRDVELGGTQTWFASEFERGEVSLPLHGLIWMASPEQILRQVREKVELGFECIKMKIGALDFEQEYAILAKIRKQFPTIEIRLDANGAYTSAQALQVLERLARFDIHFLEQPIKKNQVPSMAKLCAESPISLGLDEELIGIHQQQERERLLKQIKPQHIILKPMLLGGFAAAEEWIKLAHALDIEWWINSSLESNIGLAAIAQWASALQTTRIHGLGTGSLYANNIPGPIHLSGSRLTMQSSQPWELSCLTGGY